MCVYATPLLYILTDNAYTHTTTTTVLLLQAICGIGVLCEDRRPHTKTSVSCCPQMFVHTACFRASVCTCYQVAWKHVVCAVCVLEGTIVTVAAVMADTRHARHTHTHAHTCPFCMHCQRVSHISVAFSTVGGGGGCDLRTPVAGRIVCLTHISISAHPVQTVRLAW